MHWSILLALYSALIIGSAVAAPPPLAVNAPDGLLPNAAGVQPPHANPEHPLSQPAYPPNAKAAHQSGTVVMLLTVDANGRVSKAELAKSSGVESLDQAALDEARTTWQLLPGTVNGNPTAMQSRFKVTFKPTDETQQIPAAK